MITREDYIITNRVCISEFKQVVLDDLSAINSKYVIVTGLNNSVSYTANHEVDNSSFVDGFDIGFDLASLK